MSEDAVSREELIEARARLKKQLELVQRPVYSRDRNPQLVARLQAMIREIETLIADCETP